MFPRIGQRDAIDGGIGLQIDRLRQGVDRFSVSRFAHSKLAEAEMGACGFRIQVQCVGVVSSGFFEPPPPEFNFSFQSQYVRKVRQFLEDEPRPFVVALTEEIRDAVERRFPQLVRTNRKGQYQQEKNRARRPAGVTRHGVQSPL